MNQESDSLICVSAAIPKGLDFALTPQDIGERRYRFCNRGAYNALPFVMLGLAMIGIGVWAELTRPRWEPPVFGVCMVLMGAICISAAVIWFFTYTAVILDFAANVGAVIRHFGLCKRVREFELSDVSLHRCIAHNRANPKPLRVGACLLFPSTNMLLVLSKHEAEVEAYIEALPEGLARLLDEREVHVWIRPMIKTT